ncbi:cortexin-3 isoform X3 [Eleutherodactylus coqui]|uniref:cortexin-3 isoform X3 n=1 Tax=Eleutherodactylus coqui TaxID=57060 RepID=UPI003462D363
MACIESNAESPETVTAVQEDQNKAEQQKTEIAVKENVSGETQSRDAPAEHKPKKIRRRSASPDPLREGILPRKHQEKGGAEENLVEYMCPFSRQVSEP